MILLIDNYDSFTYNLYQYLGILGANVRVVRNDEVTVEDVEILSPHGIVISPGPCSPKESGISNDIISNLGASIPILGVCLGLQCIGHTFGAKVGRAGEIVHGKTSTIQHDGLGVLSGIPSPLEAIRYHSLVVYRDSLPDCLKVTAWTQNGLVMGLRHHDLPIEGIQFHPESIMTPSGKEILGNYLEQCRG